MAQNNLENFKVYEEKNLNLAYPIAFLWGVVIVSILGFLWYDAILYDSKYRYFLLPWCFLTGVIVLAPSLYLIYKKRFNPFDPLVYAAWIYFFPAFVIGGLVLSAGLSEPYYLNFIQDERFDLPLTMVYIILGYLGLTIGYFLPFGKKIGKKVGDWLPAWDWQPNQVLIPGVLLLIVGYFNTALAFIYGILGFQRVGEAGIYDGLLYLTTLWGIEASFILWLAIFRTKQINFNHYVIIGLILFTTLTKSAYQGNRGSLIFYFVMLACAFVFSGRKIQLKHKIFGSILLCFALLAGMIYGTTFRAVKQSDEQVSIDVYTGTVVETIGKLSDQDLEANLARGFKALAIRIDSVSPLAVVISNYEKLQPYEESYGLDNNIWKDTATFFIPRIIWHDKPVASEAFKYGDLYFDYGENSFVVTPMGDLLRNFGPIGVPLGMILLGFIIRFIYASLIEGRGFSFWRITLFYMLLVHLSYEGFYGSIVPFLVKVGFISVVGILLIKFFVHNSRRNFLNK